MRSQLPDVRLGRRSQVLLALSYAGPGSGPYAAGTAAVGGDVRFIVDAASRSRIASAIIAPTKVNPAAAAKATRNTVTLPARLDAAACVPMMVDSVATPSADASWRWVL